jgi:catechol 2,3-dioxygenase-like lactoylglutathione lyase family enzyme
MTATNLYHVGILVTDIEAAKAHFAALLGLTFGETRVVALKDVEDHGVVTDVDLPVAYSVEGPPFLELIEAREGGTWGIQHGEGLHHVGVWQDDLAERVAELLAAGHAAECVVRRPDGTMMATYLDVEHPHVHGTRLELVGRQPPTG